MLRFVKVSPSVRSPWVVVAGLLPGLVSLVLLGGCPSAAPGPGSGLSEEDDSANARIAREIEEADIVQEQDGYFYLANSFTGLRIIDGRDMSRPIMLGGLPLGGRGVELFLRGDFVFIFTAADFLRCAGEPVGFEAGMFDNTVTPGYSGSRLWVIDISDKSQPSFVKWFDFDGFATASRLVGDVVYVAGNQSLDTSAPDSGVFVRSYDISDPTDVTVADTDVVTGSALDIHVSSNALYVIGPDPTLTETTLVTFVDISDPSGAIVQRDQFRVPGIVKNRFFVDEHNSTFRIVTDESLPLTFSNVVALYTYDVRDPDDIQRLARLAIVTDETLRAVRFDGNRGYAVTAGAKDPLFVLDLSDSSNPQLGGSLEAPGFSTHLVPLDDRLVGVGFDDRAGFSPAVSLYNVADIDNPRRLSKVVLGDGSRFGTSSEVTVDEKALKVLEEAGLILLPFGRFDRDSGRWVDALQLVEMGADTLTQRGLIEHRGLVRRAGIRDERVWVLSDLSFQSVDVGDLRKPSSLGVVDIIGEQELLDAGLQSCADSARFRGRQIGGFPHGGLCGAFGLLSVFLMFAGLCAMRFIRPST